jgi:hypothetical protein
VTEYEDIEDTIPSDVANTSQEIEDAMESIQDSLQGEDDDYSLIIKSAYTQDKIELIFEKFDDDTELEYLYN